MHLRIQVDIHSLQGTVCTWVPPPPNDRLWFGFITPPDLKADATPILTNDVSSPQPQRNANLSSPDLQDVQRHQQVTILVSPQGTTRLCLLLKA
jgi:hypothetical protein